MVTKTMPAEIFASTKKAAALQETQTTKIRFLTMQTTVTRQIQLHASKGAAPRIEQRQIYVGEQTTYPTDCTPHGG